MGNPRTIAAGIPVLQGGEDVKIVIHTAERSFRSLLAIEQGVKRNACYVPLQLDIPLPGLPEETAATLTLDKMPSSSPSLVAAQTLSCIEQEYKNREPLYESEH